MMTHFDGEVDAAWAEFGGRLEMALRGAQPDRLRVDLPVVARAGAEDGDTAGVQVRFRAAEGGLLCAGLFGVIPVRDHDPHAGQERALAELGRCHDIVAPVLVTAAVITEPRIPSRPGLALFRGSPE